MGDEPQIPFGYRRVFGQLQKGDGIYDPETSEFKKVKRVPTEVIIRRTKMLYPCALPTSGGVAIRRQEVVQPPLMDVTPTMEVE